MKKVFLAVGVLVFGVLPSGSALAQSGGERIQSFDSQIVITRDNQAQITESILYDFGAARRHGIYRDIPIDYEDGSDKYYINLKLRSVTDGHSILPTETSKESGNMRIRIGDPDKTVTGVQLYQISYTLSPIITNNNGTPFLNLDVLGEGWGVPVDALTASVSLEGDAQLQNVRWYGTGAEIADQATIFVSNIKPYQGVTINADLPKGYVSTYLEANKRRASDIWEMVAAIAIIAVSVGVVSGIGLIFLARFRRSRRRRKNQTVIPQYNPPAGLLPGHVGLLQDDVANHREITATIIDWAVRGYLKIVYIPKNGLFGKKDYQLVKLQDSATLSLPEKTLFDTIFAKGNEVLLSKLSAGVPAEADAFKSSLRHDLTEQGFYDKDGHIFMRGIITEAGAKKWAEIDGFKLYLSTVEKDRLAFTDAPEKTPERFSKILPYAIALGVEKEWAKQFEGIDLTQTTTWYSGGNIAAFSAVALATDLGKSFAPAVSSNSSVSSSGGSAGGGFGGGGGGSW